MKETFSLLFNRAMAWVTGRLVTEGFTRASTARACISPMQVIRDPKLPSKEEAQPSQAIFILTVPTSIGPTARTTSPQSEGLRFPRESVTAMNSFNVPTGTPIMLRVPTTPAEPLELRTTPALADRTVETAA